MAAVTVQASAYNSGQMPDRREAGVVLCRSAKYVNSGAKDANSIIQMLKVPNGAKLLKLDWKCSALGTGVTIDIGTSTTVDKYVDGANAAAAATGAVNCINENISADTGIQIKILGAALPNAAQLDLNVYYKMRDAIADEA